MAGIKIQINLSIDRSGGAEKLPVVIEKIREAVSAEYPGADITVRKGYFQTIDGIWASEAEVEKNVFSIVDDVRSRIL